MDEQGRFKAAQSLVLSEANFRDVRFGGSRSHDRIR